MKLATLYDPNLSDLTNRIRKAIGPGMFKKREDPMNPEHYQDRHVGDTKDGTPVLRFRSGHQKGTATKPRHKKFLSVPDSGASKPLRSDDQLALGAGETPVWLGPADYGTSLRKR